MTSDFILHRFLALCPDPNDPANGGVTFTGNSVGDTATYACNTGFELIGDTEATCNQATDGSSSSFEPAAPSCRCKLIYCA